MEFDLVSDPRKNGTLEREGVGTLVDSEFLIPEMSFERRVMCSKRAGLGYSPAMFTWRLIVGKKRHQA